MFLVSFGSHDINVPTESAQVASAPRVSRRKPLSSLNLQPSFQPSGAMFAVADAAHTTVAHNRNSPSENTSFLMFAMIVSTFCLKPRHAQLQSYGNSTPQREGQISYRNIFKVS